jgi:DNA modification methylase
MTVAATGLNSTREPIPAGMATLIPDGFDSLASLDNDIPRLAKDRAAVTRIRQALQLLPTRHDIYCGDARKLGFIPDESVHLVVTSPPYWTLKRYEDHASQLGHWEDYDTFLDQLDEVWAHCLRVLVPGARVVCVVGDVCLSRRKNNGRHTVVPLHASIQERCRKLGFDNLSPIIWHKIANANYEAEGGGGGFLGKPYEPNAVVKNDIEFILMERKSGGYRKPAPPTRLMSIIGEDEHREWFQQIWHGLTGASTRDHPAPYPVELAERIVRMFSFAGDTVLDPFMGTGSTTLAASKAGRNSIGVEIIPDYFDFAAQRIDAATQRLFGQTTIEIHRSPKKGTATNAGKP